MGVFVGAAAVAGLMGKLAYRIKQIKNKKQLQKHIGSNRKCQNKSDAT